jgi:hypothetical protein
VENFNRAQLTVLDAEGGESRTESPNEVKEKWIVQDKLIHVKTRDLVRREVVEGSQDGLGHLLTVHLHPVTLLLRSGHFILPELTDEAARVHVPVREMAKNILHNLYIQRDNKSFK